MVDELALLREEYGVGHVMSLDDDLFYDHRRSLALFNELGKRNLGVTWKGGSTRTYSRSLPGWWKPRSKKARARPGWFEQPTS